MADHNIFNKDATISTPAIDIVRVLVLQRCDNALESIELYKKKFMLGIDYPIAECSSRVHSLFLQIRNLLERRLKPEDYTNLETEVTSSKFVDILNAYQTMLTVLDRIRLTRLDTGKEIDTTDLEAENKEAGL